MAMRLLELKQKLLPVLPSHQFHLQLALQGLHQPQNLHQLPYLRRQRHHQPQRHHRQILMFKKWQGYLVCME